MKFWMLVLVAILLAATASPAQKSHSLTYRADAPGIDENPLRGWIPYAAEKQTADSFPHSMEWFYLPLSDVVTGPGIYNWAPVEEQLAAISGRGHQAVFRFWVDYPKHGSGIPKYLLDAGLKTFPYDDDKNSSAPTPSVSPDYTDPRLIDCFVQFIHALGAKYDGDPRIAYLTAGLYGFWGEWHVHQHPLPGEPAGWAISQKDKDALLQAYVDSFHRTQIEVRYAGVTPDNKLISHFGFHDDSLVNDTIGLQDWQFWPTMERAGTVDSWRKFATGGEIYPQMQAALWNAWPNNNGQDLTTIINTTHLTWALDADLFRAAPTGTQRANALRAQRMLGYTLFCKEFRVAQDKSGYATLTVQIENRGVAPFYYEWPALVIALDSHGKEIGASGAIWPLPSLLPGQSAEWSVRFDSLTKPMVAKNMATVLLRIQNPMQGGHPVAFANAEMSTVRDGWLTLSLK